MCEESPASETKNTSHRKLRSVGLWGTFSYFTVLLILLFLLLRMEWLRLEPLELNQIGDLLAGLFGPLAIFWLILGFFQQGDELRNSVHALRLQAQELRSSVEQQTNLVKVTERQLALDEEARILEARRLLELELPYFLLETNGWGYSGGKNVSNQFKVKNRGTDAREIVVTIGNGALIASPSSFQTIDAGGEVTFNVTCEFPIYEHEDETEIEINGYSKGDNVRNQKFLVGKKAVTLSQKQTIVVAQGKA